ncbi:MAG: replication factor C large subunit [archaeon]
MAEPWVRRYSPKKVSEVVGQAPAVMETLRFLRDFPNVRRNALLLFGPPGVGKTAIVHAISASSDVELVELNASDFRDKASVENILGNAARQASLFGGRKIILVDEIDGISGQQDRGGVLAITDIIKETRFPIIITANDAYEDKLKTLRSYCLLVELKGISVSEIVKKLEDVCQKEGIAYQESALQKLAMLAEGDMRAAINDLQTISENKKLIGDSDVKLWSREMEESIFSLLKYVFKSYDSEQMLHISDNVNEDIDKLMLWLDQNITAEYSKPCEFAFAYKNLACADKFLHRIMRHQHWRFLVYARLLSLVGVQHAKTDANKNFIIHQRPELLLKIWIRSAKRKKMHSLLAGAKNKMHGSAKRLEQSFWPYFKFIEEKNPSYAAELLERLDEDE